MKWTLTIRLLTEAKDGSYSRNEVHTMTRQEAIERMAKAEYRAEYGKPFEIADGLTKSVFLIKAEAALNALLEDNNGNNGNGFTSTSK